MVREIPLTRGYVALVDDEDFERVSHYRWSLNNWGYAVCWQNGARGAFLHDMILHVSDGEQVDHRNGNPLDCRRQNLRPATNAQNNRNKRKQANNSSGYKGVTRRSGADSPKPWRAQIWFSGTSIRRSFSTAEEAALEYDRLARIYHGEFARLNFPNPGEQAA